MTEPEGVGDPQPQGERDDRPELDVDTAFAAIVANFTESVPNGVGPWPAAEDLDDEEPGASGAGPVAEGRAGDAPGEHGPTGPDRPTGVAGGPAAFAGSGQWDPPVRRIQIPGEDAAREVPDTSRAEAPEPDEEGYEPPEPPPLPRGDLVSRLAWAAVIGGPVFLLVAALLWRSLPTFLLLLALTAFVGGFVTLVARMPPERPDDPDDGAVV
jgi:hypothetical protein